MRKMKRIALTLAIAAYAFTAFCTDDNKDEKSSKNAPVF